MSHVSIELAKQLKSAGLEWAPKPGDRLYYDQKNLIVLSVQEYDLFVACGTETFVIFEYPERSLVWLPSFSQLTGKIGKLGFRWNIGNLGDPCCAGLFDMDTRQYVRGQFYGDIPEDALGRALLWILLERKAGKVGNLQ